MQLSCFFFQIILFWSSLISPLQTARILGVFHLDGKSHLNFHEAMMKSLLAAGHQVTVLSPISSTFSHENYTLFNFLNRSEDEEHPIAFATRQRLTSLSLRISAMYIFETYCRRLLEFEKQINVSRVNINEFVTSCIWHFDST